LNKLDEIFNEFSKNGYVILPKFFSNDELRTMVELIERLIINEASKIDKDVLEKIKKLNPEEIPHKGILSLKSINHEHMRHVVDELNSSVVFLQFCSNQKFVDIMKEFVNADSIKDLVFTAQFLRVDLPAKYGAEQKRFSLPWHQESGYYDTKISKSTSIVLNIPIFDCKKEHGCLCVKKGSHELGYVKHDEYFEDEINMKNKRSIISEEITKKYDTVYAETNAGDLLINHFNTIHSSGINDSDKVRYTMLIRISNIMSSDFKI